MLLLCCWQTEEDNQERIRADCACKLSKSGLSRGVVTTECGICPPTHVADYGNEHTRWQGIHGLIKQWGGGWSVCCSRRGEVVHTPQKKPWDQKPCTPSVLPGHCIWSLCTRVCDSPPRRNAVYDWHGKLMGRAGGVPGGVCKLNVGIPNGAWWLIITMSMNTAPCNGHFVENQLRTLKRCFQKQSSLKSRTFLFS